MHLLADEGVHRGLVAGLRDAGYSVTYVAETMSAASHRDGLMKATDLEAVLVTTDKNFGELVFR